MKKQFIVLISSVFLILLFVLGVYIIQKPASKEIWIYGPGKRFNLC